MLNRQHANGVHALRQPEASHASVLQELLLALIGHDGDVFVRASSQRLESDAHTIAQPRSCDMHLAADLPWISPADRHAAKHAVHCRKQHQASH